MRVEVVGTGNELLDGTISENNAQRLAKTIRPYGLNVSRVTVVSDSPHDIQLAVREASARADVVVISGGLGPTSDDITLEAVARVFRARMHKDSKAGASVRRRLRRLKQRKINPGQMKQMYVPEGAQALANDEGTAPGISWKVGKCQLFFLPGVPREFQHILDRHLSKWFKKFSKKSGHHLIVWKIFGWHESELNELMKKIKLPKGVVLGYRTHLPENHLKFDIEAPSLAAAKRKMAPAFKKLRKLLGSTLFSEDNSSFEESVFNILSKRKQKVALAESCTGGLATSLMTRVSGSSKVLDRSFIVYSNDAKVDLLGVNKKSLLKHGAVSRWTAVEMARGALKNSKAKRVVAITGVAGPTGGTKAKPVGTVWIAAVNGKKTKVRQFQFGPNRRLNQIFSAYYALQFLRDL